MVFRATRIRLMLSMLFVLSFLSFVEAVCPHCQGTISGCVLNGGVYTCPLVTTITANATALAAGAAGVVMLAAGLPQRLVYTFNRATLDMISFLHGKFDSRKPFDEHGKTPVEIFTAGSGGGMGQLTPEEAASLLSLRLQSATEALERENIIALMQTLRTTSATGVSKERTLPPNVCGPFSYIWLKSVEYVQGRTSSSRGVKADESDDSGPTHKGFAPRTSLIFFEAISVFSLIAIATGLANPLLMQSFLQKVIYEEARVKHYSWMMGVAIFLTYIHTLETSDDDKIVLGNVFECGSIDAHTDAAIRLGGELFKDSFRKLRGEPGGPLGGKLVDIAAKDSKKFNGKFTKQAKGICIPFNLKRGVHKQTHLEADGTCKFNHVCNHFVSDKGPGGRCGSSDHAWYDCDNPAMCDTVQA